MLLVVKSHQKLDVKNDVCQMASDQIMREIKMLNTRKWLVVLSPNAT